MTRAELGGRIEYILDYEGVKHPRDVANRILALLEQEPEALCALCMVGIATDKYFVCPDCVGKSPSVQLDQWQTGYERGWQEAHDSEAGKND